MSADLATQDERSHRDSKLRRTAAKALEQAGAPRKCVVCGAATEIHVHHIDGYELHNHLENLRYVCKWCHHVVHGAESGGWGRCIICGYKYRHRKKLAGFEAAAGFVCDECFAMRLHEEGISKWVPMKG